MRETLQGAARAPRPPRRHLESVPSAPTPPPRPAPAPFPLCPAHQQRGRGRRMREPGWRRAHPYERIHAPAGGHGEGRGSAGGEAPCPIRKGSAPHGNGPGCAEAPSARRHRGVRCRGGDGCPHPGPGGARSVRTPGAAAPLSPAPTLGPIAGRGRASAPPSRERGGSRRRWSCYPTERCRSPHRNPAPAAAERTHTLPTPPRRVRSTGRGPVPPAVRSSR